MPINNRAFQMPFTPTASIATRAAARLKARVESIYIIVAVEGFTDGAIYVSNFTPRAISPRRDADRKTPRRDTVDSFAKAK